MKYNDEHTHIVKVLCHNDLGDKIRKNFEEERKSVIKNISSGYAYCTIFKGNDSNWKKGQDVHKISIKGNEYIRTDKNQTEKDNLENLPEF